MLQTAPLGQICNVTTGQSAPQDPTAFTTEGTPFIRAGSLEGLLSGKRENQFELVNERNAKKFRLKLFPKDTVIFAKSGMSAKIGRVYRLKMPSYLVSHLAAVSPSEEVDPGYLHRWFEKNPPSRLIENEAYPSIKTSVIQSVEIPLPPLPEQRRISAILDKTDAIRRKRQQAILLTEDFLRSVFLDMFGDPVTNPKGWGVRSIESLLAEKRNAIRTGPFGSQLKVSEFADEGVPVLGIDNIVTNEFKWAKQRCLPLERYEEFQRYRVFPDDVIVTIMGTTGRVAVAPPNLPACMSTKHLCVFTLDQKIADPVFIWGTLMFDEVVRNQAKVSGGGAIMEGWNLGIIKSLMVRVPPIELQRQFRQVIEQIKKSKVTGLKAAGLESDLFNSLVQRAFRGDL